MGYGIQGGSRNFWLHAAPAGSGMDFTVCTPLPFDPEDTVLHIHYIRPASITTDTDRVEASTPRKSNLEVVRDTQTQACNLVPLSLTSTRRFRGACQGRREGDGGAGYQAEHPLEL
jgi:hypothetical protein